jgi:protein-tyrosine phosphatase
MHHPATDHCDTGTAVPPPAAKRRGVHLTSRSRPLVPLDWTRFQYIIGMDSKNQRDIVKATEYW